LIPGGNECTLDGTMNVVEFELIIHHHHRHQQQQRLEE
jgi:hypothetical protein